MTGKPLPLQTLEQVCLHLKVECETLDELVATMPRQFHRHSIRSKNGKLRQIYSPGTLLRSVQMPLQKLLSQLPVSEAAHGWHAGRSPKTNATPHVGQAAVVKLDLEDFFPSCHFTRVNDLFLSLGCSEEIAAVLTKLTTADHHLPQGFPTSPTLANLLLAKMDRRLERLARQREATYTRYGDDLAFSGRRPITTMVPLARRIIGQAGHTVNAKKFAENGVRFASERQEICAITVNKKLNLRKSDYRRYRDILHRSVLYGPACEIEKGETLEHMKARLRGYINYVRGINRQQAQRLQSEFDQIIWTLAVVED